ncbi:MAG: PDZ domain-containing protein [Lachnospiraceae bacterium]|nr:PDZ domain-containing protein [Lachnospiraceae bacterium]
MVKDHHEPEKEFQFIQEKVVPRRKNRIKRVAASFAMTIVLAVIFGIIARVVFIKSESWVLRLLGMDIEERQQITIPSEGLEEEIGADITPIGPSQTMILPTLTPTPEPEEEKQEEVTVVEQKVDATIADYEKVVNEIKRVATSVSYSLVTVTAVENGVDWFNDAYETRKDTSGIVIGENKIDLLILTNFDRIQNADKIEITFGSTTTVSAELWEYDEDCNLAVVAVPLKDIPSQQLSQIKTAVLGESYSITVGTPIIALGNPNGYAGSMEIGMITSKGSIIYTTDNKLELFNTDITDNENSDGIIVNMKGEIIGIITRTLREDVNQQLSTAIGISRLKGLIEKMANKEERVYFGIRGEDVPLSVLQEQNLENGIYVNEVLADSPAFKAGIKQGDIITSINDTNVVSITNFANILNTLEPKQIVKVSINRNLKNEMKEMSFQVTLQKK